MGQLTLQNPYLCRYYYGHAKFDSVVQLQERLNEVEPTSMLNLDGFFGEQTQETVKRYQERKRIRVDGIVGPETLGCLNSEGKFNQNDGPTLLNTNGHLLGNNTTDISYNENTARFEIYISEDINAPISKIGMQACLSNQTPNKATDLFQKLINENIVKIIENIAKPHSLYTNASELITKLKTELLKNRHSLISSFFEEKKMIIDTIRDGFLSNDDLMKNRERLHRCNEKIRQYYRDFNYRTLITKYWDRPTRPINRLGNKITKTPILKQLGELGSKVISDPVIMAMYAGRLLYLHWTNDGTSKWEEEYLKAAYAFYDAAIEYIIALVIGIIAGAVAIAVGASSGVALAVIGVVMVIVGIFIGIVNSILDYVDSDREKLSEKALKWACQFI